MSYASFTFTMKETSRTDESCPELSQLDRLADQPRPRSSAFPPLTAVTDSLDTPAPPWRHAGRGGSVVSCLPDTDSYYAGLVAIGSIRSPPHLEPTYTRSGGAHPWFDRREIYS
jgi:hypothetical protein